MFLYNVFFLSLCRFACTNQGGGERERGGNAGFLSSVSNVYKTRMLQWWITRGIKRHGHRMYMGVEWVNGWSFFNLTYEFFIE